MIPVKRKCVCLSTFLFFSIVGLNFAAGGFEYLPDESTLGLWHFDGGNVSDTSDNAIKAEVEGIANLMGIPQTVKHRNAAF